MVAGHQAFLKEYTLPKTNIAPENGWLEDKTIVSFGMAYFQGQTVSFGECIDTYQYTLFGGASHTYDSRRRQDDETSIGHCLEDHPMTCRRKFTVNSKLPTIWRVEKQMKSR